MAQEYIAGRFKSFLDSGAPNASGRLYTYASGTTTHLAAYTDATLLTPCTYVADGAGHLYIALDARGEAQVWLGTGAYTMIDATSLGVTITSVDGVQDLTASLAANNITFTQAGGGAAARSMQDKAREHVSLKDFGATLDGVTDDHVALSEANAQAAAIGAALIFQGVCHVASPVTITAPIADTTAQLFSSTSQVTVANGLPVRPEWFGGLTTGCVLRAAQALPQPLGGVVELRSTTYPANGFAYNGTYMNVPNVKFRGARMPRLADDCKSLVYGTIIQGLFLVYADNVTVENVGIDSGNTYTNGGTAVDALLCTYGSAALQAANTLKKGLRLHNVIGLCNSPTDPVHGVIAAEGYKDVICTGAVIGVYGVHGVVVKGAQVTAELFCGYLNGTDGVIIKTDSATTQVSDTVQIGRIVSLANGPVGYSPYVFPTTTTGTSNFGMLLHCYKGNVSKVQIGEMIESGHAQGLNCQFDGAYVLDGLQIGSILTDGNADYGVHLTASTFAGATMQRVQIGRIENRNSPIGTVCDWQSVSTVKIGAIHAVNCTTAGLATTSIANPMIDTLTAENCGGAMQITSNSQPRIGKVILAGSTASFYQSSGSGLVPALSNSWAQVGGADTFQVLPQNWGIEFNGLISGGVSNVVMTVPQFARPFTEKRLMVQGRAGATQAAVPIVISSAGVVTINDAAGGTANVTTYLSLAGVSYRLD